MDSPSSTTRIAARSSMIDSIRGCGLSGMRIDKEDLRRKLSIPEYLRVAMSNAIRRKEGEPPADTCQSDVIVDGNGVQPPEAPMVVFINSRSGGRHGPELKERLQELMGKEQVFDLSEVKPHEFVQYGLACLEKLAELGDFCAKDTRQKMRIVVAGGDGTVGWVLGSVGELNKQGREPVPPVAIIPLGTGNDLSRSFGWGGSFPFAWKSAVKRTLQRASAGPICRLDSWHAVIQMPSGEVVDPPHSLKPTEDCALDQGLQIEGALPEKVNCYEGVFYNYFSIGMDAQVAYGFHHLRNEKPYLAQGPISNKLIYSGYSCTQGDSRTSYGCMLRRSIAQNGSRLQSLKGGVRISGVRAIVALNLHNYASGRNPWGNLSPEYLEKKGFVEAHADDGLLEIFGLKQGWHASFVMVELISAKHIAQAAAIRLEFRGGEWKDAFMQMDGEPWKQPLNRDYSTFVEIKRVPFQSLMISGE
ncbi:diacylglycerol kinase 7 [Citrus sinensis]|uniref:Diacylglycerol kinase 7 n=1 Tax=Citrus sinensis TaxID=2711 RepID=A0ACB8P8S1_CITSI|nr:diacylglycerol kinase 7 [Citrus sinensis]KAH9806080.1 diacylglycerol kinase 7 [Citrus sinensis]